MIKSYFMIYTSLFLINLSIHSSFAHHSDNDSQQDKNKKHTFIFIRPTFYSPNDSHYINLRVQNNAQNNRKTNNEKKEKN